MANLSAIRSMLSRQWMITIRYRRAHRPRHRCNGGLNGKAWCGLPGEVICTDRTGMQWFACVDHTEGAIRTECVEAWFARHFDPKSWDEIDVNLPRRIGR